MWIDAALQFADAKCEECGSPLVQVWIGEEQQPDLHYIHCSNLSCEAEYDIVTAFYRKEDHDERTTNPLRP
jgi:hypothetical protein